MDLFLIQFVNLYIYKLKLKIYLILFKSSECNFFLSYNPVTKAISLTLNWNFFPEFN